MDGPGCGRPGVTGFREPRPRLTRSGRQGVHDRPPGLAQKGMPMYERLLVAVDHSEVSGRVIAAARDLALLSTGKGWVLHIREREFGRLGLTPTEPDEEAHQAVSDGVGALSQAGVDAQGRVREAGFRQAAAETARSAKEPEAA